MMLRRMAVAGLVLITSGTILSAQERGSQPKAMTLTAQDYLDIQQLSNRYAFLIDTCTNGGYDFADLFTVDGEFSVSQRRRREGRLP